MPGRSTIVAQSTRGCDGAWEEPFTQTETSLVLVLVLVLIGALTLFTTLTNRTLRNAIELVDISDAAL
jgi:hypothetical protein